MRLLWTALAAALPCAACAAGEGGSPAAAPPEGVPANALPAGDGLWMVPLPDKVEGCPAFRPVAPGRMTVAAIYYRKRGGGFTLNRAEADCG
jgi:hypothetical protein